MEPVNSSSCRKFEPRKEGVAKYRSSGKPTFNPVPVCGPKPCPVVGQTRNSSGNCKCPPDQEEVNGKCVPKCDPATQKREGDKCVSNCDLSKNDLINGKCLPKCPSGTHREGDKCVSDCDPLKNDLVNGKCLPKCPSGTHREGDKCVSDCDPLKNDLVNGKCLPKCPSGTHREGDKCVSDCDPLKNDLVNGKCLPKCPSGTHREGDKCVSDCDPLKNDLVNGKCLPKCKENEERKGDKCIPNLQCDPVSQVISSDGASCDCKKGYIKDNAGNCHEPLRLVSTLLRTLAFSTPEDIENSLIKSLPNKPTLVQTILDNKDFKYFHKGNSTLWQTVIGKGISTKEELGPDKETMSLEQRFTTTETSKGGGIEDIYERSKFIDRYLYEKYKIKGSEKLFFKLIFDVFCAFKSRFSISDEDFVALPPVVRGKRTSPGMYSIYLADMVKRTLLSFITKNNPVHSGDLLTALIDYSKMNETKKTEIFNRRQGGGRRKTIKHRRRKTIKHRKLRNKKTIKKRSKKQNTRRK
jgi:hypothetical protein